MRHIRLIWYIFLGLALVLLDVSFFAVLEFRGAAIVSSFLTLIVLAISDRKENFVYFSLVLIILLTIFSSLPISIIGINFLVLPWLLNFAIKRYFRRPDPITNIFYLSFASLVFSLTLMIWANDWSLAGFVVALYFTLINSLAGWLIGYVYLSLRKKLTLDVEIKI